MATAEGKEHLAIQKTIEKFCAKENSDNKHLKKLGNLKNMQKIVLLSN